MLHNPGLAVHQKTLSNKPTFLPQPLLQGALPGFHGEACL